MMKAINQIDLTERDRQEDDFCLADLWYNLCDHWRIFCAIVAGFVVAAGLYGVFADPVYKADALIQVQKQQGSLLGALPDVAGALNPNSAIEGEPDVISSRAIVGAAINNVHAETKVSVDSYFPLFGRVYAQRHRLPANVLAAPVLGLSAYAWGGEQLGLTRFVIPEELYTKNFYLTIEPGSRWTLKTANDYVLTTGKIGELRQFTVGTDSGTKGGAILVSNYIGRPGTVFRIVQQSPDDAYEAASNNITVAETTKDSSMIRVTFASSDPGLAAGLVNGIADAYVALNIQKRSQQVRMSLDFLREKLPSMKQELDASENRLNEFRIRSRTIDVQQQTEALLTRAVDLTRQKTAVRLSLEANAKVFEPDHPAVLALRSQIGVLDNELASVDRNVEALPATQQDYLRLARDVTVNTQLYTALLANAQQLEVAEAGTTGNVFVVDRASIPTKMSWPSVRILLSGGFVVGLFFAFVCVQFFAAQRNVLRDPLQIKRFSRVPLYSTVPSSKFQETLMRSHAGEPKMLSEIRADDPSIEALRSLRSTLQLAGSGKGHEVVLFTGPTQGVGKSFISTNFAYLLALSNRRVLVIDADMRRSSFHNYLPANQTNGLAEVLAGTASLEQTIYRGVLDNLDYLPAAGRAPSNPAELLDRPQLGILINRLKTEYDYVIIDSPPVLPLSDALAIAAHCDQVFVVSRSNMSTARQLIETITRLETAGIHVTGHVFNGATRYGYGYKYAEQQYGTLA
jgi:tyrosine-protein kinase Etk/Wzc